MLRRDLLLGALFSASNHKIELGRTGMSLYYGAEFDKPFVYPIRTTSGRTISRGYPMEKREGETTDHVWHRGFWYGHGVINGADFWREQGKEKSGRLMLVGAPRVSGERVSLDLLLTPPSGEPMGSVRQQYRIHDRGRLRFVDSAITIDADQRTALTFGDTDDGGFAMRLSDEFAESRGARLVNSDGLAGTKNIWGKPAQWVDYSIDSCGVAMFDHPTNLRHPTRWHARGYSLCSANPFGERSFSGQKPLGDSYTLPAGQKLTFRYRVVIHEGRMEPGEIGKLYAEFR